MMPRRILGTEFCYILSFFWFCHEIMTSFRSFYIYSCILRYFVYTLFIKIEIFHGFLPIQIGFFTFRLVFPSLAAVPLMKRATDEAAGAE
jgi:hypothetical protein